MRSRAGSPDLRALENTKFGRSMTTMVAADSLSLRRGIPQQEEYARTHDKLLQLRAERGARIVAPESQDDIFLIHRLPRCSEIAGLNHTACSLAVYASQLSFPDT